MTKLLIATNNRGKLVELQAMLADLPLELVTLRDVGIDVSVEETGDTFAANAILKAEAYAQMAGLWTLADDSGLDVDALDGAPGVYSARYGAPAAQSDRDRYQLLLRNLDGVPWAQRTARFRCVVALTNPVMSAPAGFVIQPTDYKSVGSDKERGATKTVEGVLEGYIAFEPKGDQGFGYDPVFYVPTLNRTVAELPADVKNHISHRGQALQAILPILTAYLK